MKNVARVSADPAEQLSALVDGELELAAVAGVCAHWHGDASSQTRWHGYQLIGDVLRSEDLASTRQHDTAFLIALRARLAAEPVVLAPGPSHADAEGGAAPPAVEGVAVDSGRRNRRRWFAASAVAAGFMAVVAGNLVFVRAPDPTQIASDGPERRVPSRVNVSDELRPVGSNDPANEPQALVANGKLIRDARIDRYLAAHQQWSGGSVIGGHAAFLRHVAADAPKR